MQSSLGASSELLAFDLAVASYKRDLSDTSTPLGTSKNLSEMTKSSDISGPLDITSVNFAGEPLTTVLSQMPEHFVRLFFFENAPLSVGYSEPRVGIYKFHHCPMPLFTLA